MSSDCLPSNKEAINKTELLNNKRGMTLPKNLEVLDELLRETVRGGSNTLTDPLQDRGLSSLGDTYLNFIYSLAASLRNKSLSSLRISNKALAEAMKQSGFRSLLPHRLSTHDIGNSAEAMVVYAIVNELASTGEIFQALMNSENLTEALTDEFKKIKSRWPNG